MGDTVKLEGLTPGVIVLIGFGLAFMLMGVYYSTFYKDVYFVAEGVPIFPGEARDILVVPDSVIVIESYDEPLCPNGKLVLYDNLGNIVWQSTGRVPPEKAVIKVTTCYSGECIFKMVNTARCTIQEAGHNALGSYTLYVYYRPDSVENAARILTVIGLIFFAGGVLLYKRNIRKANLVELEPA